MNIRVSFHLATTTWGGFSASENDGGRLLDDAGGDGGDGVWTVLCITTWSYDGGKSNFII